jgi:hypothetical protein
MTPRLLSPFALVGFLLAVIWLAPVPLVGQSAGTAAKPEAPAKPWKLSRTPDGQPDLQGFWTNTTYVPLERPKNVTKAVYTREEVAENIKRAAATESEQTEPGTVADVHYDFTQFGLDRSQGPLALNLRTSLIVDPPDGRIPPMTAEGQRRAAERAESRKRMGGPYDAAQNQPLSVRCIIMDRIGPPMLAGAYNNNYQIVQTPDYVMIRSEMYHNVRVIPLDNRARTKIPQWVGESRARWEGDTLVVETSSFLDRSAHWWATAWRASRPALGLVERFRRVDAETLDYEFTMTDPVMFTRPWTARFPLTTNQAARGVTEGPMYEYACHEGNYSLANVLRGARLQEK